MSSNDLIWLMTMSAGQPSPTPRRRTRVADGDALLVELLRRGVVVGVRVGEVASLKVVDLQQDFEVLERLDARLSVLRELELRPAS